MSSELSKYRPVLNADQISHICYLARLDGSDKSISILATLASFEHKIKCGAITPAYTSKIRETLGESLGFESHSQNQKQSHPQHSAETLYALWADDPSSLNVEQLKLVRAYRYTNNKMTVEEEAQYEREVLGMDI